MKENTELLSEETIFASDEIERESYNKSSLKRVMRVREKGAEYGIDVPFLNHPLSGNRSVGIMLKIMTIITGLVIALGFAGFIWAIVKLVAPVSDVLKDLKGGTENLNNSLKDFPIFGSLTALSMTLVWAIMIAVPVAAVAVVAAAAIFLLCLININKLTIEEKAVGYYLGKVKTSSLVVGIVFVVVAILFFALIKVVALGIVSLVVAVYAFVLFVALQLERNRAKAVFADLPEEQQQAFIEHSMQLEKANSRRSARKAAGVSTWGKRGKLSFLFSLFYGYADERQVYQNLKNNPRYKDTSTSLAKRALWQLLSFFLSAGIALLFIFLFRSALKDSVVLQVIFIALTGVMLLYSFAISFPLALNCTIKQLKLNKKPLGWVALALTLSIALIVVIGIILLFTLI